MNEMYTIQQWIELVNEASHQVYYPFTGLPLYQMEQLELCVCESAIYMQLLACLFNSGKDRTIYWEDDAIPNIRIDTWTCH